VNSEKEAEISVKSAKKEKRKTIIKTTKSRKRVQK
jgi:hypothetical protein